MDVRVSVAFFIALKLVASRKQRDKSVAVTRPLIFRIRNCEMARFLISRLVCRANLSQTEHDCS